MSGTAGGTIILHVSPKSAIPDSPFGVIQTGDMIEFDAERRILRVDVDSTELQPGIVQRKHLSEEHETSPWKDLETRRGDRGLYERTLNQAHEGADFAFLTATRS